MRHIRSEEKDGTDDSFLDVIANVVGVLIILVMLVGAQASRGVLLAESNQATPDQQRLSTVESPSPDTAELSNELEKATQAALASQRAIQTMATQVVKINHEAKAYDQQRIQLAMHRSVMEEEIERRKSRLDEEDQQEFDVQRQLLESKLDLDTLSQERLNLISASDTVTEVECVPTPLAKVIEGKAVHLRLSKGLVSIVPLEELMAEIDNNLNGIRRRLQESGRVVETFGPLDGYRLKLTVAKRRSSAPVGGPLVGQVARAKFDQYAEIRPTSETIGQNVEQSLLPSGMLFQHLEARRRQRPAVVVWLYTDSFDEFRPLKQKLWEMGFSLATRPMRPGTHIGASPNGSRAAAQ